MDDSNTIINRIWLVDRIQESHTTLKKVCKEIPSHDIIESVIEDMINNIIDSRETIDYTYFDFRRTFGSFEEIIKYKNIYPKLIQSSDEDCLKYIQLLLYGPSLPYSGTISNL